MAWAERLSKTSKKWRGGWRDADGIKRYTRRPEFPEHPYPRKTDALEAAKQAEAKATRTAAVAAGTASATMLWGLWWELIKREHPHTDSARNERDMVNLYIRPKWASTPLVGIKRKQVQDWIDKELSPGRGATYVRRIYAVFSWSMTRALAEEILDASPCVRIKLPTVHKKPKPRATLANLAALEQVDEKDRPHLRVAAHREMKDLQYETGLRPGELCGLHDDQVDLDTGWLEVTNVFVTRRRAIRPWPKDKDARRVPLTGRAVEILRRCIAGLPDDESGCGVTHTDGSRCEARLVFRNNCGLPVTPHAYEQAMRKASKRAAIKNPTPYGLRRAFFDWMAEGGLDPFAMAAFGGHEDVRQTADYVGQTSTARDRLRAARGERGDLRIVAGESTVDSAWGRSGADLPRTPPDPTGLEGDQDAV
jgi:integrase